MDIFSRIFGTRQSKVDKSLAKLRTAIGESKNHKFQVEEYNMLRQLAFQVADLGEVAVEPLCKALEDPDDDVRQYVALALTRAHSVEARVKALVVAASRIPLGNVDETTAGVVAFGKEALEPLLQTLEFDNGNVRWAVSDAIAKLGPSISDRLIHALDNRNPNIREAIVRALCSLTDPSVLPSIIKSLTDEADEVRWHAAYGLRYFRDPAVIPPLVEALENDTNGIGVRLVAAFSLLELGWTPETESQQVLISVFNLAQHLPKRSFDPLPEVIRFGAAAVGGLQIVLETCDAPVRCKAVKALGEIYDERARHLLLRTAENDPDSEVKHLAKFALDKIGTPHVIEFTSSVHGRKSKQLSHAERTAGRNGKCRKCELIIPLSSAYERYADWDGVDVYHYYCPHCHVEKDIYTGRLLDRFGVDLIDQFS
jgi:bilin biosynthesis protein